MRGLKWLGTVRPGYATLSQVISGYYRLGRVRPG